jgi:hypothetical protein
MPAARSGCATPRACATWPLCWGPPGRPVHAADLVAAAAGEDTVPADLRLGADEVLDDRARAELRARLLDLEEEIEEADRWHD